MRGLSGRPQCARNPPKGCENGRKGRNWRDSAGETLRPRRFHPIFRVGVGFSRCPEGFSRLDARIDTLGTSINARVDHLTERMEEGFSRMDTRLDALTSAILNMRQPTYPDAVLTRLEKLEREIENLRKQAS